MIFSQGVTVRLSFVFTNTSGDAADPTTISVYVRPPKQGRTKYVYGTDAALVKDSTGMYHLDVTATHIGRWEYEAKGSGVYEVDSPVWSYVVGP